MSQVPVLEASFTAG